MKTVNFFLDNRTFSKLDCSAVLESNPGIGGTEWMILVVSTLLSDRDNGIDVRILATADGMFPAGLKYEKVEELSDAIMRSRNDDYLVFQHDVNNLRSDIYHSDSAKLRLICWCHYFVCQKELDYYADNKDIWKIVYVGREMYDLYRDHRSFYKSCYIYNCVPLGICRDLVKNNPRSSRNNNVVFMGSLVPFKGFHILAEAWPKVVERVPDANLYVIGSGRLYIKNAQLGTYGLAGASYEERFMQYLARDGGGKGKVHFLGIMGNEKKDSLLKARVGVPNPSGISETFCISAVEMQQYGATVTTINFPGYLDTVKNGKLITRKDSLADSIVALLQSEDDNYDMALDYFENEFSYEHIAELWRQLLIDGSPAMEKKIPRLNYRLKWLKEVCRIIKKVLPLSDRLPMLERIIIHLERKKFGRTTYLDS